MYTFIKKHKVTFVSIGFLVFFSVGVSFATPPTLPYTPGDTLDPQCAPGSSNCTVVGVPVSGSPNYLQNGSTPQAASFNISGNGTVGGTLAAGTVTGAIVPTGFSTGSLSFTNNSGVLTQDNANLFYDATNHRLGLGTNTPVDGKLTIVGNPTPSAGSISFGSYTAFGDSITYGYYASVPANNYVNLLASQLGLTAVNTGVAGAMSADQQSIIFGVSVPATGSPLYTNMIGTNDLSIYSTNTDKQGNFRNFISASMAWLAIPNSNKMIAQSGTPTYVGSWSNSAYYGGTMGKVSSTNGDTATFSTNGTTVYVGYTMVDGNGGQFSVIVDGVNKGTFNNYGQNNAAINTNTSRTYGEGLARITGLSSGTHTVVVTVASATGAGNSVYVDWVSGNGNVSTTGPMLIQGGISARIDSPNIVPIYNALIASDVSALKADGLNVYYADTLNNMNTSTDLNVDGLHPNDTGHLHIEQAFYSVISAAFTNPQNTVAINSSSGASQFVISSSGYLGIGTTTPTSPFTLKTPSSSFDSASSSVLSPVLSFYTSTNLKSFEIRVAGGTNSIGLGVGAGSSITSGIDNNFMGQQAGYQTNIGSSNNFFGYQAGYGNTSGSSNNFMGMQAGYSNTVGTNNNFMGQQAGFANTTGSNNTFIGQFAGTSNTSGNSNAFIGYQAGRLNTTGQYNTFIGPQAGYNNIGGMGNNFIGYQSGYTNSTGGNNTFMGQQTGFSNTTGSNNHYFGYQAGYTTSTGNNNTFIGQQAGYTTSTGGNNMFVGQLAGYANTTGNSNVFLGFQTGRMNTIGQYNNFLGPQAGYNNLAGSYNNAFGYQAGYGTTNGNGNNTFGQQAGFSNTTGSNNNFFGYQSGYTNSTGSGNAFIGLQAGYLNTTGANNVLIGYQAGYSTDASDLTTGSQNIVIGYKSGLPSGTASNQLSIGNFIYGTGLTGVGATVSANGKIGIGTAAPQSVLHVVDTSTASPRGILLDSYTASTNSARLQTRKARGTTAAPTTVVTGDNLGSWMTSGYDGTAFLDMASINVGAEGTIATNRIPTNMRFSTATDAAPSVLTEAMRIDSNQHVGIGVTAPTAVLNLRGGTATPGTAPLKFTSGTLLSTTEAGAIEYDGTHIYFTAANAGTRYQLDQQGGTSPLTTKGDLYTYSTTNARLPVGTDGQILSADSTQPTGLKWITASGTGTVTNVSNVDGTITVTNGTTTPVLSLALNHANTWTASQTQSASPFIISGNQSTAAWGVGGVQLRVSAATLSDTSSSGTVAVNAVNAFGIPTLTASSATTYTNASTVYIAGAPVASTNATISSGFSLYVAGGFSAFVGGLNTGSGNSSNLTAYGGNAISNNGSTGILFAGASNIANRVNLNGTTSSVLAANVSYANFIVGSSPVTAGTSGTHALLANTVINPLGTVTAGVATVTNTASLYVNGASSATVTGNNYSLWVNGGLTLIGSSTVTTGTTVARFQNAGGTCDVVPSASGGISCSSDMNLKKNITTLADGSAWSYNANVSPENQSTLAKLLALTPVSYNWNIEQDSDPKHAGFIAQEVRQVFPDLVTEDAKTHLLSLNYAGFMPYTVQAIQEMNVNITDIANLDRPNTWRESLIAWMGSATNGITDFFSKKVTTDQLCLKGTCLTEDQLKSLLQLQQSNQGGNPNAPQTTTVVGPAAPEEDPTDTAIQSPEVTPVEPVTQTEEVAPPVDPAPTAVPASTTESAE